MKQQLERHACKAQHTACSPPDSDNDSACLEHRARDFHRSACEDHPAPAVPGAPALQSDAAEQSHDQASAVAHSDCPSLARKSRGQRRVSFAAGPLPGSPDGHPVHEGACCKPRGQTSMMSPGLTTAPPEALTRASLQAMEKELGPEFQAQNALSLTRLKRRVRALFKAPG